MCESKVLEWLIGIKWMVWIGEWLNRQKVRMPRITYDDVSTNGKFMHGAMVREWDFKFARFVDPALPTDWVRLLWSQINSITRCK